MIGEKIYDFWLPAAAEIAAAGLLHFRAYLRKGNLL